jgi:ubiquinone biosynthesis protein
VSGDVLAEGASASLNHTADPALRSLVLERSPNGHAPTGARRRGEQPGLLGLAVHAAARAVWLAIISVFFLPQVALRRRVAPVVLRRYLQACGGGFVKLGQTLAMRYDLLPQAYCDELLKLLDQVPATRLSRIERIIAEDLGQSVSSCFSSFEPVPLGSASIAQVHAARLASGESVAVKVARPGIARTLRIDLAYLRAAGRFTNRFGIFRHLNLEAVVREVSQLSWEELDFRREARNAGLFHRILAEDEVDHCAPRVYFGLSGPRVITLERIEGVPLTSLLAAVQQGDRARLEGWAQRGIRARRTARLLLRSILEQTMHHRVFNADPHPANLIVKDGGTLAWLDFGMVGWLEEGTWARQFRMQRAIATEQVQPAVEALMDSLAPLPAKDLSSFELQAGRLVRDWIQSSRDSQATIAEKSTARFFMRLFEAIRVAGISVPPDLVRLYRMLIVSDLILLGLDPGLDWVPELREFVGSETGRQLRSALRPDVSIGTVVAAGQAWFRFFTTTANLVNWLDVRIPELTRAYQNEFSNLWRVAVLLLRYLRAGLAAFVVVAVLAHVPQLRFGALASLDEHTGPFIVALVLGSFVAVIVLSRILGELQPR